MEEIEVVTVRHLAIRTGDLPKSRRFYEEGLGMRFLGTRPSSIAIDLSDGAINLTLLPYEGPVRSALPEGNEFVHLGFLVDDLGATYQRLSGLGATIVRDDVKERRAPSGEVPRGSFKVLDPDGVVLDISERPDEWRVGGGEPRPHPSG
jgi:catechol 2,3-dioxygenase-like lactoylglutathione lyase family enzyme